MSDIMKMDLSHALMELLKTKRLEQITIKELTQTANCSRMSFYYHFRSLNDLVEYTFLRLGDQIIAQGNKNDSYKIKMKLLMTHAQEYKEIIFNVYDSTGRAQVEKFLYQVTTHYIEEMIDRQDQSKNMDSKKKEQIIDFYKYSCVGPLLDWVESGMPDDFQETIDLLSRIILKTLPGAFEAVAEIG